MSLDVCIPDLLTGGKIDAPRGAEARALYEELKRFYGRSHSPDAAAALASAETVNRLALGVARKKRLALKQVQAQVGMIEKIMRFDGGTESGILDPRGAEALFSFDGRAGHNDTVVARQEAIRMQAHAMMAEVLRQHRQTILGTTRNPAQLNDIVRELFRPGSTGSASARELADGWSRAAEWLRARHNEAGGAIGKLEDWGLPQSHNAQKVRAAGWPAWRDTISPLLDRSRMIDDRTGQPFTDQTFELTLRDVFETIRTDGWSKIEAGATGGKMLANQKAAHRFLHFADADGWLAYADQFGSGNAFDAMMGHVSTMARDISLMEILGPNPAASVRWLKDTLQASAAKADTADMKAVGKAFQGAQRVQRYYDEVTGALRRPESERLALAFSTVRSVQTSAKLGSATLSAVSDLAFGRSTRKFNGLPWLPMFEGYLRQLNPLSADDRMFAVRQLGIAEDWASTTAAQYRYLGEEMTGEWQRRLASGVLRASGLNAVTAGGQRTFGLEFMGHLTNQRDKGFDQLDPALQRAFTRHGIGPQLWETIRNAPIEEHRGSGWILPKNVEDPLAVDRLFQMIATEMDYAVPVADLRTRAMMNSVAPRGTLIGETIRQALQFKTFGISIILTHGRRMIEQGPGHGVRYAAGLFIAMTVMGAVSLQLHAISKGMDPAPMNDDIFWYKAALQGGGFGILGDFINNAENRFGSGIADWAMGPSVQTAQNVGDLTLGNAAKAYRGDKTDAGRDLVKIIKQETPGQSLWYARLAFEREVVDLLSEQIDPNYRRSWRAMEKRAKDAGQDFYWEPGDRLPDRAPDLANMGEVAQ